MAKISKSAKLALLGLTLLWFGFMVVIIAGLFLATQRETGQPAGNKDTADHVVIALR